MTIRVLLVDDHAILRAGLRRVLESEAGHRGGRRGRERRARRVRGHREYTRRGDHGRRDAGNVGDRRLRRAFCRRPGRQGPRPLDAGRPALCARRPSRRARPATSSRRPPIRRWWAPSASGRRGEQYVHPALGARMVAAETAERKRCRGGPAVRPRARGPPAAGARPHESGDREDAVHLGAHSGDAPGPHHAEARASAVAPSSCATRSTRV